MIGCCIVAKNEERNIAEAIMSVTNFVDEVVVVDNQSTDNTKEIAVGLGCRVYECSLTKECDTRNFGLSCMNSQWVLVLDADERMDKYHFQRILDALEKEKHHKAFRLPHISYCGSGQWTYGTQTRLFANQDDIHYCDLGIHTSVQESLRVNGYSCGFIPAEIHHYDFLIPSRSTNKRHQYIDRIEQNILSHQGTPKEYKLRNYLGLELIFQQDYSNAVKELRKSINYNNSIMGHLFLMMCYCHSGDLDKLDEALKVFFSQFDNTQIAKSDVYQRASIILAELQIQRGEYVKARRTTEDILRKWPQYAHNYINLAAIESDESTAVRLYEQAIQLHPYILNEDIHQVIEGPSIYKIQKSFLSTTSGYIDELRRLLLRNPNIMEKGVQDIIVHLCSNEYKKG